MLRIKSKQRLLIELQNVDSAISQLEMQWLQDQKQIIVLSENLKIYEAQLASIQAITKIDRQRLEQSTNAMHAWQERWHKITTEINQFNQLAIAQVDKISYLGQQINNLEQRLDKLNAELQRLDDKTLPQELVQLEWQQANCQQLLTQARESLAIVTVQLHELRANQAKGIKQRDGLTAELQELQVNHAALVALQQAAVGSEAGSSIIKFIEDNELNKIPTLAETISLDPKWHLALETVLGPILHAYCVESIDQYAVSLNAVTTGPLQLFETDDTGYTDTTIPSSLQMLVTSSCSLTTLLGHTEIASNLTEALERRFGLNPQQFLVTPEGICVGRNWLKIPSINNC
ncbi:hypothetical protein TI04_07720 [Achromatium sp. WMS2]|nr:hypothetical protein TI04_07720 [Achromatium sp. WMS2]